MKPKVNITLRIDEDLYKKFESRGFNFSRFMQDSLYSLLKEKKVYLNLLTGEVLYNIGDDTSQRDGKNGKEQLEFCEILDKWYLNCKSQFKGTHPLGMRKEDLKDKVCKWIESKNFQNVQLKAQEDIKCKRFM